MGYWLGLFLMLVLQVFLGTKVALAVLPMVVLFLQTESKNKVYFFAFVSGLLTDLFLTSTVGKHALMFLLFALLLEVLEVQFKKNWKVLVASVLVFELLYFAISLQFNF